jgi:DNA polymerase I-like protein with 3'-5' exonuclease and polymerase domains
VRIAFDLESDGLLPELTKIHCIAFQCLNLEGAKPKIRYTPTGLDDIVKMLNDADEIIGHNILNFDIPAIQKVYTWFKPKGKITDTLVLSRLIRANLREDDLVHTVKNKKSPLPGSKIGSHSLAAWGIRLDFPKGDYTGGWQKFTKDMATYCMRDVDVTVKLYDYLLKQKFSEQSIALEHKMAVICDEIGANGWTFDIPKAKCLYADLVSRRAVLADELKNLFEPWVETEEFIPKRDNKTLGYKANEPFIKRRTVEFNPNSRAHIARCLIDKYSWKPVEFTPTKDPKIDDLVLANLPYPEAQKIAQMFLIQKRIAMLGEGKKAWMSLVEDDGKIRHQLIANGTVSGRASCRSPNLQQVPGLQSKYGKECRELFTVPHGWTLCGADLSGIEVRCLAHFLFPWDKGEYANIILSGDIHTHNQKAAGLAERSQAKTMLYAMLFGSGNARLGEIVGGKAKDGKAIKDRFNKAVPAFANLQDKLRETHEKRGHLIGLDGRKLYIRSAHRALSQLLQSAGALISKQWIANIHEAIATDGLSTDARIVGWIHDEVQIATTTAEVAEHVGNLSRRMAQKTGRDFNFKIAIEAEYSTGKSWADTH